MVTTDVSGRDIETMPRKHGSVIVDRSGSHLKLQHTDDVTGEVRNVTVPQYDRIDGGLLQTIADQCGANDFREWCRWIDRHR